MNEIIVVWLKTLLQIIPENQIYHTLSLIEMMA